MPSSYKLTLAGLLDSLANFGIVASVQAACQLHSAAPERSHELLSADLSTVLVFKTAKNFKNINSESLVGQVLISIFDKLILGFVVLVLFVPMEQKIKEIQERDNAVASISNIKSQIIIEQRSELIKSMINYLEMVEKYGDRG